MSPIYRQEGRLFKLNTPLGEDVLLLKEIKGEEGISQLYSLQLNLLSENHSVSFADIIGQSVTIAIALEEDNTRYFNGIVSDFSQSQAGEEGTSEILLSAYSMTVVPWLWLLTKTTDCKIFQNKTVPEIVEDIFREKEKTDYRMNLRGNYTPREYCVQYRESDFNFISRLLEEEGIYYFFQHEEDKHTLILADDPSEHPACPNQETARCRPHEGGVYEEDMIDTLGVKKEIRAGKYTLKDYNFKIPNTDLKSETSSSQTLGPDEREYYDYPGGYDARSAGDTYSRIRMEEEEAGITTLYGTGKCRAFASGYKFRLEDFYRDDMNSAEYVLTTIRVDGSQTYSTGDAEAEENYLNAFTCIPIDVPFRPRRTTRKPLIEGVQTAFVVGPSGEEVQPDEHGRVKVQFHWDRLGEYNEDSSCWIRVGQIWAGNSWGAMFIPRIGQEVIVNFLEGDPDRPIITGCVYHGLNRPPYPLPDEKTKSTIKSDSSKGGGGFNEIRFEDKKGEEQLFIHAQRNQDNRVGADSMETIGGSRHLMVSGEQRELVKKDKHVTVEGNHKEKIDGDISLTAGSNFLEKIGGNHHETISGSQYEMVMDKHLHVQNGFKEKVGMSKNVDVFGFYREKCMIYTLDSQDLIHLKAGMQTVIESGIQISLKVGSSFISISPAGVDIQGTLVNINSGGAPGSSSGPGPEAPTDPKEGDFPELPQQADTAEPGERPMMPAQIQAHRIAAALGLGGCPN